MHQCTDRELLRHIDANIYQQIELLSEYCQLQKKARITGRFFVTENWIMD